MSASHRRAVPLQRGLVASFLLLLGLAAVVRAGTTPERHGNAWRDPANPVVKRFQGERLNLWSLKKPVRASLPVVRAKSWVRNPIDRFILARLEAAKLTPSAEADRRTLVRRLYFDLLGLPPTPEEVQQFVADSAPDAYERLVERLLANRHYGERWGRHWLDVVRYADGEGFERDEFRPNAWRYRDYVIQAFIEDKPYDTFIREQLAGDELAHQPLDERGAQQLIATGYLRMGPYDSTATLFKENSKGHDYLMADLVNTTGSAFLGLTVACCQCHDHKYDPLLQADHYRLRAFFAAARFRDDLVIEPAAALASLKAHYAAVDARTGPLRTQIAELTKPARERVARRRSLGLALLAAPLTQGHQGPLVNGARVAMEARLMALPVRTKEALPALQGPERKRYEPLARQVEQLEAQRRSPGTAMAMVDSGPTAPATHIFAQGDINRPLNEVPPGFLSVLDPNPAVIPPPSAQTTGRRTILANWIASKDNPLTARVLVNRLWQHHFGQGLVATPNDFGFSGSPPTHPALLDWLAVEFMESGWSIKHLHRLIVCSAAYRQVSTVDARKQVVDPDNRLLWRQNLCRLEAETLRDAQLLVAGKLRPMSSGPPRWPEVPMEVLQANPVVLESEKEMEGRPEGWYTSPGEEADVRTVYTIQKRSIPEPLLQVFDLPDAVTSCGRRNQSTVAPQALALLNGAFGVRMARAFADRVAREAGNEPVKQVKRAVWLALSRPPAPDEQRMLVDMLTRHRQLHQRQSSEKVNPQRAALVDLCRALLNANEFLYID
jgi:hypothetical protein